MTSDLMKRVLKASTLELTSTLDKSKIFNDIDSTPTPIPALNIAYSGSVKGGLASGITVFAGPSKHFKSLFTLITAKSYMDQNPEAVMIFYDCEFGSTPKYFDNVGIDRTRVMHKPFANLEEFKIDITNTAASLVRGDKAIIVLDSLGNAASVKETKDALSGSDKADMTRGKTAKSIFRIITAQLKMKDIPMLVVAHTYDTQEMFSKQVVGGGKGIYYGADSIFIIGRQQKKDGVGAAAKITGYNFIMNVEKSRFIQEKSKIPLLVMKEGGIAKWSGLFDIALDVGTIVKSGGKSYDLVNKDGEVVKEEFKRAETENSGEFWKEVFSTTNFADLVEDHFGVNGSLVVDYDVDKDDDDTEEENQDGQTSDTDSTV